MCLDEIDLHFSPYYRISFDSVNRVLTINKNEDFPKAFFGEGISTITAIVGNNGAGKTTAIKWILDATVEGSGEKRPDGIIVYEKSENNLVVYLGKRYRTIEIKKEDGIHYDPAEDLWDISNTKIRSTYYSGHFYPYTAFGSHDGELAGEVNVSDSWLLLKDLMSYSNNHIYSLTNSIGSHLYAFSVQNSYRIAHMLMAPVLRKELSHIMKLPKYIIFNPNHSGRNRINEDEKIRKRVPANLFNYTNKYTDKRDNVLDNYIIAALFNYMAEYPHFADNYIKIATSWMNYPRTENGIISDFYNFYQINIRNNEISKNLLKFLKILDKECDFRETPGFFYLKIEKSHKLEEVLSKILLDPTLIVARFFDISYALNLTSHPFLSSGEAEMLNLLSRIYWHLTIDTKKFSNLDVTPLIVLDEAEIGFHPEWQKQYIEILTFFFSLMSSLIRERDRKMVKFQIIYTTHSPISLSDMPKECVNFLIAPIDKDGECGPTVNISDHMPQTFGENIFELYRNSFFMHDGLIGSFAQRCIGNIERKLTEGELPRNEIKEIEKTVSLIGDERIKIYLLNLINRSQDTIGIDDRIGILEKQIELLKKMKSDQQQDKANE